MVIARDLGLAIHHVAVQTISGQLSVSADLEVDGTQPLAAAHEVASRLEEACATNSGRTSKSRPISSRCRPTFCPATTPRPPASPKCASAFALAAEIPDLGEVHDVRVRETPDGEIVNFHCLVDPALSVAAVHDLVDALERRLRRHFPAIQRVIGHAEPRR